MKIRAHFQSSVAMTDMTKPIRLLQILREYESVGLTPKRFGSTSSRTFDISQLGEERIKEIWKTHGIGYFKRARPWDMTLFVFLTFKGERPLIKSDLWIRLKSEFFGVKDREAKFVEYCKEIYRWGQFDYAYVAVEDEYEMKNSFGKSSGVGGPNLEIALPGIYWCNFFGPIYAKWFGESKFQSLQTLHKERLSDGGWMFLSRPNLLGYEDASLRVNEKQIMNHLGSDAFFEMDNPDKPVRVPNFASLAL